MNRDLKQERVAETAEDETIRGLRGFRGLNITKDEETLRSIRISRSRDS
jgi:hypothetical protein